MPEDIRSRCARPIKPRTDFAIIETALEAIHARLAGLPTYKELAKMVLFAYVRCGGAWHRGHRGLLALFPSMRLDLTPNQEAVVTRFVILVSTVLISALITPAIAGYFPSRPAGVPLQYFTGVMSNYSVGNGIGGFDLTVGETTIPFNIGRPITMNGTIVDCRDSDCPDWPSEIVEGRSIVTATCWSDTEFPGTSNLFCDEIDSAPPGSKP